MDNDLKNKICVVIGGTRGIGFTLAVELYRKGAFVIIAGRNLKVARSVASEIDKLETRLIGVKLDVNNESLLKKEINKIFNKYKRIDVLINASGIFEPFGIFEKTNFTEHIKVIETNLLGTMRICHTVLPHMKKRNYGRIILFSGGGVGGDQPLTHATSYYTSKGAVAIFTEVIANENEKYNITVNAVLPGQILTDSTRATFRLSKSKLGPVLGKATQVLKQTGGNSILPLTKLVLFLLSDKGKKISGRLLSARWDDLSEGKNELDANIYKMRRIEGRVYKEIKKGEQE